MAGSCALHYGASVWKEITLLDFCWGIDVSASNTTYIRLVVLCVYHFCLFITETTPVHPQTEIFIKQKHDNSYSLSQCQPSTIDGFHSIFHHRNCDAISKQHGSVIPTSCHSEKMLWNPSMNNSLSHHGSPSIVVAEVHEAVYTVWACWEGHKASDYTVTTTVTVLFLNNYRFPTTHLCGGVMFFVQMITVAYFNCYGLYMMSLSCMLIGRSHMYRLVVVCWSVHKVRLK